jgi:protein TonB
MTTERKKPEADLRNYYTLILEGGLIVALAIFVLAFKVDLRTEQKEIKMVEKQETVKMEEVERTKQVEKPPPPPRPPVPVEVPNDEVIEDEIIDLDADLDLDGPVEMPPPPPPAEEEEEEEVFVVVERMPELKGGQQALYDEIEYPELARKAGIEGRVFVEFVVDENGNVTNPRVVRGIGGGCDEEALRAVKQMSFTPGMQRGRPVKVKYSLPVMFKLQN